MASSNKVNKHYSIDKQLIDEIEKRTLTKFKTKTEGIEYYLKKGLEYETKYNDQHTLEAKLSKTQSEILFIKRMLMQMFANYDYPENKSIKECKSLFEFVRKFQKSEFSD